MSSLSLVGVPMFRYAEHQLNGTSPWADPGSTATLLLIGSVLAILVAWVAVFWRTTWPAVAMAAGTVLTIVFQLDYLLVAIGLAHWIGSNRGRWRWHVAGAGVAVMVFAIVRNCLRDPAASEVAALTAGTLPTRGVIVTVSLIIGVCTLAITIGSGLLWSARRDRAVALQAVGQTEQANTRLHRALSGHEQRDEIAREIHDSLAHRLSLMSLRTQSLADDLGSADPARAQAATELRGLATQSLDDLRGLVDKLRSDGDEPEAVPTVAGPSLAGAPRLLAEAKAAGAVIDDRVLLTSPETIAPEVSVVAYRVLQEALTNAIKHGAQPVAVTVLASPAHGVMIDVRNPLPSADAPTRAGSRAGIGGMRSRVGSVGGQFASGVLGAEFVVTASLPWGSSRLTP